MADTEKFEVGLADVRYGTPGQAWADMTAITGMKGGAEAEMSKELYDIMNDESALPRESVLTKVACVVRFMMNYVQSANYGLLAEGFLEDQGSQYVPEDLGTRQSTFFRKWIFRPKGASDDKNDLILQYAINKGSLKSKKAADGEAVIEVELHVYAGTNGSFVVRKDPAVV